MQQSIPAWSTRGTNASGRTEDLEEVEGEVEDKEEALMAAMRAPLRRHRPVAGGAVADADAVAAAAASEPILGGGLLTGRRMAPHESAGCL